MTGDFSRSTFDPTKHYDQVLLQQGRVQMDADWNEATAIAAYDNAAQLFDIIGPYGTPQRGDGFLIDKNHCGSDLTIHAGHFYMNGTLVVLDSPTAVECEVQSDPTKIVVKSWMIDGLAFEVGQTVELRAGPQHELATYDITQVDQSHATITLDRRVEQPYPTLLERVLSYRFQPFFPAPEAPPDKVSLDTFAIAYLGAWQRIVTALEDPELADPALGGPDTAVRRQTVWQVRLAEVNSGDPKKAIPEWQTWLEDSTTPRGLMRAEHDAVIDIVDNQLYRVQIHAGTMARPRQSSTRVRATQGQQANQLKPASWQVDGIAWEAGQTILVFDAGGQHPAYVAQIVETKHDQDDSLWLDVPLAAGPTWDIQRVVTFKWAASNASIACRVAGPPVGNQVTLENGRGRSAADFGGGWVEFTTTDRELRCAPGVLVQVTRVTSNTLTVDAMQLPADFGLGWYARRWDGPYRTLDGLAPGPVTAGSRPDFLLAEGISVAFDKQQDGVARIFQTFDFWQIPARTNTQALEWPLDNVGQPAFVPPSGMSHTYCPLALVTRKDRKWTQAVSLRPTFGAMLDFVYRAGDTMTGQLVVNSTLSGVQDHAYYDLVTGEALFVHFPTATNAEQHQPPEPRNPDGKPPIVLVTNGSTLIRNEDEKSTSIQLEPAMPARSDTATGTPTTGVRLILVDARGADQGWVSPHLEFSPNPDDNAASHVVLSLEEKGPRLKIARPVDTEPVNVKIFGNLEVTGTINGRRSLSNNARTTAVSGGPIDLDALSRTVLQQAETIAELVGRLSALEAANQPGGTP